MGKKSKKAKLPKELGGVKLPKQLRRSAEFLSELAQNPVAREVASAALIAAAAALATRKDDNPEDGSRGKKPGVDVGGLLTQGLASFLAGLAHPSGKAEGEQSPDKRPERPKPKLVP
jgi:hypothetical protein